MECERALRQSSHDPTAGSQLAQIMGEIAAGSAKSGDQEIALRLLKVAIDLDGQSPNLRFRLGTSQMAVGDFAAAINTYHWLIANHPQNAESHNNLGSAQERVGRLADAVHSFRHAVALRPEYGDAWLNLGLTQRRLGDINASIASLEKSVALQPQSVRYRRDLARSLLEAGRGPEAEAMLRELIRLGPADANAVHDLAVTLLANGRPVEAADYFSAAMRLDPNFIEAAVNLGATLRSLGRLSESVQSYQRALELNPRHALAACGLGIVLRESGDMAGATASLLNAIKLDPGLTAAHIELARTQEQLSQRPDAVESLRRATLQTPQRADLHYVLATMLHRDGQLRAALASYDQALLLNDQMPEAHLGRAQTLESQLEYAQAVQSYKRVLALRATDVAARAGLLSIAARTCQWEAAEQELSLLRDASKVNCVHPTLLMGLSDDPAELKAASMRLAPPVAAQAAEQHAVRGRLPDGRIRVAYVSADFREHPTSYLIAELLELHDRARFEIYCLSIGPDDSSDMRARIVRACDHFVDARGLSDAAAADWIRSEKIDIAVDLNGYIKRARPWILASHPAPIQVSFLGFPGTMASGHIDYLVADDFVIPESEAQFYQEAVVYLPGSYQVNDRRRPLPDATQPRQRFGLPSSGIVFCAFNNSWKITRPVFVTWMQILKQVEGSVLWLLDDNPWATGNLRNAARLLGVSPERLVFAPRVSQGEHLGRHGAADLFLDTLPCNGHTTASDALWSGVPIIARTGRSFASRVAGSLLRAVGLPELITASATEYIATAVALASDPSKLAQTRDKLLRARGQSALFDSSRFRQHLERAYGRMVDSYASGAPRAGFYISPDPSAPTATGAAY